VTPRASRGVEVFPSPELPAFPIGDPIRRSQYRRIRAPWVLERPRAIASSDPTVLAGPLEVNVMYFLCPKGRLWGSAHHAVDEASGHD
jgi:hypothetical protein